MFIIYRLIGYFKNKKINILDIGTGSGCILLAILKELNNSRGIGIDISYKAVQVAKKCRDEILRIEAVLADRAEAETEKKSIAK